MTEEVERPEPAESHETGDQVGALDSSGNWPDHVLPSKDEHRSAKELTV